ncbi:MAG: SufB/SufD family protein [Bdellovibrionota bacterium]
MSSVINDDKYVLPKSLDSLESIKASSDEIEINYRDKFYINSKVRDGVSIKKYSLENASSLLDLDKNLNFFEKVSLLKSREILVIEIFKSLKSPLRINYFLGANKERALYSPIIILDIKNSSFANIIETYIDENSDNTNTHLVLPVSFVNIFEGCKLEMYRYVENESNKIIFNDNINVLGEFNLTNINFSKNILREKININLLKRLALSKVSNINFAKNSSFIDVLVSMNHKSSFTRSAQDVKFVLKDSARTAFTGEVVVEKNLEKIKSTQLCRSMLFSKDAKAKAKPWLKIFSDDVECSHGATYGELDRQKLFYLLTRGIKETLAKKNLAKCFYR